MRFDDNLPIYLQIINYIKRLIVIGELREGDKLLSVREMSTKLKVNPNTVQRSYQELEREGLVFTKRGMGSFVTEEKNMILILKKTMASDIINGFIEDMKHLGYNSNEVIQLINEKIGDEKNE